jgi:Tol biopolymer transport system component
MWVINADGSGTLPISSIHCGTLDEPAWSPDAKKIAFVSSSNLDGTDPSDAGTFGQNPPNIWVMNADGSGAQPLTLVTFAGAPGISQTVSAAPAWSPDGTKIIYSSIRALDGSNADAPAQNNNIWIMNADGSGSRPLTQLTADPPNLGDVGHNRCFSANWSPDGSKIAMQCIRPLDGTENGINIATSNIWMMNADGSGAMPLTKYLNAGNAGAVLPDSSHAGRSIPGNRQMWSPDGSKIAFLYPGSLDGSESNLTSAIAFNIWVINSDGSGATPVTRFISDRSSDPVLRCPTCFLGVSDFAWSPDGNQFVFVADINLDGGKQPPHFNTVWVINVDGSKLTVLTTTGAFSPMWKP